jgi:hypothetical protein
MVIDRHRRWPRAQRVRVSLTVVGLTAITEVFSQDYQAAANSEVRESSLSTSS